MEKTGIECIGTSSSWISSDFLRNCARAQKLCFQFEQHEEIYFFHDLEVWQGRGMDKKEPLISVVFRKKTNVMFRQPSIVLDLFLNMALNLFQILTPSGIVEEISLHAFRDPSTWTYLDHCVL